MEAIVLAAGRGRRMQDMTLNRPKCLLEVQNGMTVLDLQIKAFEAAGITRVVVVTGYMDDKVEEILQFHRRGSIQVETCYNPFYQTTNNLVSLWLGLKHVSNEFIVVNGDNVFHPSVLHLLFQRPGDVCMVISRKESYDDDDMKVVTKEGLVRKVGKTIPLEYVNAESIGMVRFSREGARILRKTLDEILREQEGTNLFWLAGIQKMIDKGLAVTYVEIEQSLFGEIDFPKDLIEVRSKVRGFCLSD